MRRRCFLGFEDLEDRKLLSAKVHHAVKHPPAAVNKAPLVINGTLKVDQNGATVNQDGSNDSIETIPVAGQLAGIGEVRGTWNETTDPFGDYMGPDTIQLHNSKGAFIIAFNNGTPGKAHRTATGTSYKPEPQRAAGLSGSFVHTAEIGTITLNSNPARTAVTSLTVNTTGV